MAFNLLKAHREGSERELAPAASADSDQLVAAEQVSEDGPVEPTAHQPWQPDALSGNWRVVLSNYAEVAAKPSAMTLRPFEAVWWLQA